MADDDLRNLERAAREEREDARAWIRYVRALERERRAAPDDLEPLVRRVRASFADSPAHALLDVGDEVWVEERSRRVWIRGRWRGVITEVKLDQDGAGRDYLSFRVRPHWPDDDDPDAEPLPLAIPPLPEHRVRGFVLDRDDRLARA